MEPEKYIPVLRDIIERLHEEGLPKGQTGLLTLCRKIYDAHGYSKPYPKDLVHSKITFFKSIRKFSVPRWVSADKALLLKYRRVMNSYALRYVGYSKDDENGGVVQMRDSFYEDPTSHNKDKGLPADDQMEAITKVQIPKVPLGSFREEMRRVLEQFEMQLANKEEVLRSQAESLQRANIDIETMKAELLQKEKDMCSQQAAFMKVYEQEVQKTRQMQKLKDRLRSMEQKGAKHDIADLPKLTHFATPQLPVDLDDATIFKM